MTGILTSILPKKSKTNSANCESKTMDNIQEIYLVTLRNNKGQLRKVKILARSCDHAMILSEKDGWLPWDATKTIKNEILKTKKNTQSIDC